MAEASDTYNTSGTNVAAGNYPTMNVTYNNTPPVPHNLPPGSRVEYHITYTIADPSGAASPSGEEEQHEQIPTPQRRQPPPTAPRPQRRQVPQQQQQQQQQSAGVSQQPRQQQQPPPSHIPQQPSRVRRQLPQPQISPSRQPQQQQTQQQQQQQQVQPRPISATQGSNSGRSLPSPQQETSPGSRLQPPVPETDQGSRTSQSSAHQSGSPAAGGSRVTSQASYDGSAPTYSLNPMSDHPAMPLQSPTIDGNSVPPIQETGYRPPLNRSSTDPSCDETTAKTPVSLTRSLPVKSNLSGQSAPSGTPYSLNPSQCPIQAASTTPVTQLELTPKSDTNSTTLTTINPKFNQDKPPDISDVTALLVDSKVVLVLSDMANCSIIAINLDTGTSKTLKLSTPPISLSRFTGDSILTGYFQEKKFSIINIKQMKIVNTYKTKSQYSGIAVLSHCQGELKFVACCPENLSVDVLDHNFKCLKRYCTRRFQTPCFISVSSAIFVTDWTAKTLSCLSKQGEVQFIASLSAESKNPNFRGVVQNGNEVFVADEDGDRILSFDPTGRSVRVVLDSRDGISKPCGLCVLDGDLYIAQTNGLIKVWRQSGVSSTRL